MKLVGENRFDDVAWLCRLTSRFGVLGGNLILCLKLLQKLSVSLEVPEEFFFRGWENRLGIRRDAHGSLSSELLEPLQTTPSRRHRQGGLEAQCHAP